MGHNASYLYKHPEQGTYFFRMRIPSQWKRDFGSSEVRVSLKTGDLKMARKRCASLAGRAHLFFSEEIEMVTTTEHLQIKKTLYTHLKNELLRWEIDHAVKERKTPEEIEQTKKDVSLSIESEKYNLEGGRYRELRDQYIAIGKDLGLDIDLEKYYGMAKLFCHEFSKMQIEFFQILERRLNGDYGYERRTLKELKDELSVYEPETTELKLVDKVTTTTKKHTVKEITDKYLLHIKDNKSPKTLKEYQNAVEVLRFVAGDGSTIDSINHDTARKIIDVVKSLPAHKNKRKELRNLSFAEQLQVHDADKISPRTVDNYIVNVSAIMTWMEKQGYIDKNFLRGKHDSPHGKSKQSVFEPFSKEDLQKLFPHGESATSYRKPWQYYIPLMALCSGARRTELAQLLVSDVIFDNGLINLVIRPDGHDKTVKTNASIRTIPLHPYFTGKGFEKYYNQCVSKKNVKLFPELTNANDVTKYFSNKLSRINIVPQGESKKKSFHSFRTLMATYLKYNNVPERIAHEYLGHEDGDMSYDYYAQCFAPSQLFEQIKNIDVMAGVDISRLTLKHTEMPLESTQIEKVV